MYTRPMETTATTHTLGANAGTETVRLVTVADGCVITATTVTSHPNHASGWKTSSSTRYVCSCGKQTSTVIGFRKATVAEHGSWITEAERLELVVKMNAALGL